MKNTIGQSHKRSADFGIDPESIPRIMLSEKDLEKKIFKNKDLLEISESYVSELLEMLGQENGFIAILTDKNGVILEIFGDEQDVNNAARLNLIKGANMDERSIGTNAMGTAIREGHAVQVTGEEHFIKAFQRYTCSAAPIHDSNNAIIGTLNITALKSKFHPFTLGLISSTAKSIENRIHNSAIQRQLFDAQQYAFSIINHLTFGVIAVDMKGFIHWVNDTACRALNIRRTRLIDQEISIVCSNWEKIRKNIDGGAQILDQAEVLNTRNESAQYLINAYSINDPEGNRIGYVITFRPLSRMLNLINKYSSVQLRYTFDMIVYKSKKIKNLIDYAKAISNTPSTILITGESGTGKEVFAQAIHHASERRNNAFVALNCGAISSSLIESELFGYEEGAFTGASKGGKPGKFELANGGTLFLDEIGEMPLEMQVKLLRVLQEKSINRIGGSKAVKLDVRVIAATNKKLKEEVENKNFREDLFYRLSVIPLEIPPLRERRMDVPALYRYFLEVKAHKLNRPIPPTDKRLIKKLVQHDWPGNIRELENFAEKAVILGGNTEQLYPQDTSEAETLFVDDLSTTEQGKLPTLAEIEKAYIQKYLEQFQYNVTHTAKTLGIGRNTLYQKIEKYRIKI